MKLYEYQAKEVFKEAGIVIPNSKIIHSVEELKEATNLIGFPCVIKSQVLSGGRGKAGLISFVKSEEKAIEETTRLFNHPQKIKNYLLKKR